MRSTESQLVAAKVLPSGLKRKAVTPSVGGEPTSTSFSDIGPSSNVQTCPVVNSE
jgi:hypothetical protein